MFFKKTNQKKTCLALMTLLFAPYFLVVLHKGGIGLLAHLIMFLGVGLSGILFYYALRKGTYKERELPFYENVFLILTIVFFSLSYIYSTTRNVGLLELGSLYSGVILIFIGYNLAKDKKHLKRLFSFITFSLLISLIIGFAAFFTGGFERFAGSFNNFFEPWSAFPNAFGDFLLLTIPITFYLVEQRKKTTKNLFTYIPEVTFVLSIAGLILTNSQGIYIAATLLFVAMFVRLLIIGKFAKHLVALILSGLFIGYASLGIREVVDFEYRETVSISETENIDPELFEHRNSVNTRLEHFKVGAMLTLEAPLFGFGPGSYPYVSANRVSLLNNADHPHNVFLKIGVENGILTLLAFTLFLSVVLLRAFLIFFQKFDPARELVFLGVLSFLVHQLIDYNLNFASISFLFYIMLGILIIERIRKSKRLHIKEMKYVNHFLIVFLGVAISSFALNDGVLHAKILYADETKIFELQSHTLLKRGYFENFSMYQMMNGEENIVTIQEGLALNPYNDALHALKSDFGKAYELNPNNLRHLLALYESASDARKTTLLPLIHNVLNEYLFLLETNAHFTILSDNPLLALSLARITGDNNLVSAFEYSIANERSKFSKLYNIDF